MGFGGLMCLEKKRSYNHFLVSQGVAPDSEPFNALGP